MIYTDQLQHAIELKQAPRRIISLVPSISELLWHLGLRSELIGITKFCIHPKQLYASATRIGGTKTLDLEKIKALRPDLIIGNKEENDEHQINALKKEFRVWMSDIYTLQDAINMINAVGELVNKPNEAFSMSEAISTSFLQLRHCSKSVLYLIWQKPYMAAGKMTFIGDLLHQIGLVNVLADETGRYPVLEMADIQTLQPDVIFLSSEPYPFKEKEKDELQRLLPNTQVMLVDGELFSWYGSRLIKSVSYFNKLIINIKN